MLSNNETTILVVNKVQATKNFINYHIVYRLLISIKVAN